MILMMFMAHSASLINQELDRRVPDQLQPLPNQAAPPAPPAVPLAQASSALPTGFVPIDIVAPTETNDPEVRICQLNFDAYALEPHSTPMFKDLVAKSCPTSAVRSVRLSQLAALPPLIKPTGFVFHEARVGSTLAANMLAVDPRNLVYSESAPPASALLHCDGCSVERRVHLLRVLMNAMGNAPPRRRMFFKFQSAMSPHMEIVRQAFPDTPWVFLFRHPVEVMMSHLSHGANGPCLRHQSSPPKELVSIANVADVRSLPPPHYCALHLRYLSELALRNVVEAGWTLE